MVNLHEAHIVLRGTMTLAYLAYDASQTNRVKLYRVQQYARHWVTP